MVDTKKEQERDELHRAIWAIADELRGAVDGWDFKNYVLGTMFYRYISENLCNYINSGEIEAGNTDFDYAKMSDEEAEEAREGLVEEKGFFILPSELFCNPYLGELVNYDGQYSNDEVSEIFTVPLAFFQNTPPKCYYNKVTMYPTDNFPFDKVPGGKEYPWARGEYEVLFYEYDDRIIWGLTAKILYYNLKMIQ